MGQSADHPGRYRHGLLISALAGCGRFAFDETNDAQTGPDAFVCATPVNHDEDGDAIDDGCDLCPVTASATNDDTDRDGVGDLCDPEPTNARQRVVYFESFVSTPTAAWGTDAEYIPDAARLGITGGNLYNSTDVTNVDIYLAAVINSVHATVQNHFYLAVERTTGTKWYAELVEDPGGSERRFTFMYYDGSYDGVANQNLTTPFTPSPIYWHYGVRATGEATSSVTLAGLAPSLTTTFSQDVTMGQGIHLFVGGMQIDITGILVVETQ